MSCSQALQRMRELKLIAKELSEEFRLDLYLSVLERVEGEKA